jgi:hypothetical protein
VDVLGSACHGLKTAVDPGLQHFGKCPLFEKQFDLLAIPNRELDPGEVPPGLILTQ